MAKIFDTADEALDEAKKGHQLSLRNQMLLVQEIGRLRRQYESNKAFEGWRECRG